MKYNKRIFDILDEKLLSNSNKGFINTKYNDTWEKLTVKEFYEKVQHISAALISLGVTKGDKIALISTNNRTEWCIMDMAILQIGAINVPIYPTITAKEYVYVLNHSESKYCFLSDVSIFKKLKPYKKELKTIKHIYSFEKIKECNYWWDLVNKKTISYLDKIQKRKEAIKADDLATIIYTSGTTGIPKGVMLTHKNIMSNLHSSKERFPIKSSKEIALSFLPLCHVYERLLIYLYFDSGVEVYFAESIEKLFLNIKEVKPHIMTAVPRLLEKMYDKIYAKGKDLSPIKQKLFYWAVNLGLKYEPYRKNGLGYAILLFIARKLIFSKWKKALGGNLHIVASASSALQPRLARIFTAAEILIIEGYGLTETSPVISVNDVRNKNFKIGTVGKILSNVEVKIAKDGEILCKGPNIMKGYYKEPKKTAEAIQKGYFYTGDIGQLDNEGFLKITDRKKEIFKTSGGKYIAPQLLENTLKQSLFIEQIMIIGENKKMPAALIQPDFEYIKEVWAPKNKLNLKDDYTAICNLELLKKNIRQDILKFNNDFSQWQRIKKFELTPEIWTVKEGHLTPTLKMKRKFIKTKYQYLYDKIYKN